MGRPQLSYFCSGRSINPNWTSVDPYRGKIFFSVRASFKILLKTFVNLAIYFNCKEKLSALPLNSFYRYVLEEEVRFGEGGLEKPMAYFYNMPQTPVLTMNVLPPESWMIESVRSPYDLDNIFLLEVDGDNVYGRFMNLRFFGTDR